jgi:DNA-binding MarR family transcriptional regulator
MLSRPQEFEAPLLIGALLRFPSDAIHRRLVSDLNKAGFDDFRLPYIAVFQYPTPDGCRPSELAARAGMSKQAMHRLLESLEALGYITRSAAEEDGRARVVRFTDRGRAVWDRIYAILVEVEKEWRAGLGDEKFEQLKALLYDVWASHLIPSTTAS